MVRVISGRVTHLHVPDDARWDSGIEQGSSVTPHYDSLLAKLIVHAADRDTARRKLARALDELLIGGLVTNSGFQRWLIEQPPVVAGRVTTRWLDEREPTPAPDEAAAALCAAGVWNAARSAARAAGPWTSLGSLRLTPHRPTRTSGWPVARR